VLASPESENFLRKIFRAFRFVCPAATARRK